MVARKSENQYVLCDEQGIFIEGTDFFDTIETWEQALSIALMCLTALRNTLEEDAVNGDDTYVGDIMLTTGLDRSLDELYRRFPHLMSDIDSLEIINKGRRLPKC